MMLAKSQTALAERLDPVNDGGDAEQSVVPRGIAKLRQSPANKFDIEYLLQRGRQLAQRALNPRVVSQGDESRRHTLVEHDLGSLGGDRFDTSGNAWRASSFDHVRMATGRLKANSWMPASLYGLTEMAPRGRHAAML